jgi:hypothetical protein
MAAGLIKDDVLPDVRRREIISPQQWFDQNSIAILEGAFCERERMESSEENVVTSGD